MNDLTERQVYLLRRAVVAQMIQAQDTAESLPAHQHIGRSALADLRAEFRTLALMLIDEQERRNTALIIDRP
jgi:hypothetical protein